jgi:hypothetical protein
MGDFFAVVEGDGGLEPHALAQVAKWLDIEPTIDLVYSDEDEIDSEGNLQHRHIRPVWSPDLLMSQNYISRLAVMRRSVFEIVVRCRSEFDSGHEHDFCSGLRSVPTEYLPLENRSTRAVTCEYPASRPAKRTTCNTKQVAVRLPTF